MAADKNCVKGASLEHERTRIPERCRYSFEMDTKQKGNECGLYGTSSLKSYTNIIKRERIDSFGDITLILRDVLSVQRVS
ncbi:hypothetical protein CEXT_673551 [Caerostris extrusa]|uniref:Uncharacterized protein n=1 Tax=Caerostris extrusa TaxID=172846 RepID=A0AAV4XSV5_CAEEX|nr:hypothetical protein CEXT_673551 [Caerostris extrusa]